MQRHRRHRQGHVKMEAKIGAMLLPAKERQGLPTATEILGEARKERSLELAERV